MTLPLDPHTRRLIAVTGVLAERTVLRYCTAPSSVSRLSRLRIEQAARKLGIDLTASTTQPAKTA